MRKPTAVLVALSFFIVTACGRVAENQFANKMTQDEAMQVLAQIPPASPNGSSDPDAVSAQGLTDLIQDMVQSGEVQVPKAARGAISSNGTVDTATLNTVLSLLSQGKGVLQVAKAVSAANGGNSAKAKLNLDGIVAILQSMLPVIATVAPQYAAIIQAAIVLIPMIQAFLALFKKPSTTTSSLWLPMPQNPGFVAINRC